ncbi:MAG: sugar transferase [Erythrobacter sp.]|jgi:lipopolysaccharide/colanic/teichoic acid biosynthesis glycosyltransferase
MPPQQNVLKAVDRDGEHAGANRPAFAELAARFNNDAVAKRKFRSRTTSVLVLGDILIVVGAILGWATGYLPYANALSTASLLIAAILPVFLFASINLNSFEIVSARRLGVPVMPAVLALVMSIAGVLLLVFLTKTMDISRLVTMSSSITALIGLIGFRALFSLLVARNLAAGQSATLCIYEGMPLRPRPRSNQIDAIEYGLAADPSDPEMIRRLAEISKDFDRLVVHCPPERRGDWIFVMRSLSIPTEIVVPELEALAPLGLTYRSSGVCAVITTGPLQLHERAIKRAFDLAAVVAAMPLLLPLTALIALAIKLDSRGPVFFLQDRIGRDNRPFKIFKFRSMVNDRLDFDGTLSTQHNDPRITRVGALLRRTSLDEIPQLFNVLIGEMSIVGPRPHARLSRAGDRLFWEVDTAYWQRHSVKPGITGLAQIRGYRGNTFHEHNLRDRLTADLEYVNKWSLKSDIRIILQTFGALTHKNAA